MNEEAIQARLAEARKNPKRIGIKRDCANDIWRITFNGSVPGDSPGYSEAEARAEARAIVAAAPDYRVLDEREEE
jgi:hypothetical protein